MSQIIENTIILGSGPAGLTAAIYCARASLRPLLIEGEEVGGQLSTTTDVENFPGFPEGILGPDLMTLLHKQAERFGTRFASQDVKEVDCSSKAFKLSTAKKTYYAKSLILSTGASAKYLGVKGEKEYLGRGVSSCATCDGFFFKNLEVIVVGGGDTAMEESIFLTRFAKKIWIIHRRDKFRASQIMVERVFKNPKIEVLWNTELIEVLGNKKAQAVERVILKNNQTGKKNEKEISGVFIAIGHKPNTKIFKGQIEMDQRGYIITKNKSSQTSCRGVFAAGDVQDATYRQAITAAGSGCTAAMDVEKWLEEEG